MATALMQDINTFLDAGWDFVNETANGTSNYWTWQPGSYPHLAVFSGDVPAEPNGAGTWENPYLLTDANDLGTIWYRPWAHYRLTADIDLAGMTWGSAVILRFSGYFDGHGHQIRHLQIYGGSFLGLFGECTSEATIRNLGLKAVDVNSRGEGDHVGGLVGVNDGVIMSSYSVGSFNGEDLLGGLVGSNGGGITSSYSAGSVSGTGHSIGGLVGWNYGTITSSYSRGSVSGTWEIGGLVGGSYGSITMSSFWDTETSGQSISAGGIGLTTSQMQNINTYLNASWDFMDETANGTDDVWTMPEGDYPRLWWEE